jgi:hypothetical protein
MGEMRNDYNILTGTTEGNGPFQKSRFREGNNKRYPEGTELDPSDWIGTI